MCRANNMHSLLCLVPITTTHSFGSCTITHCTQFLYHELIFHMHFSLCITQYQISICPHRESILCAQHTKLSWDNIYPYCTCAKQTPLCFANNAYTLVPLFCVSTLRAPYYACALCAMPNLVHTPAHHILLRDTTIYRAHLHANIFHAVLAR
jgi:hypothetical protein